MAAASTEREAPATGTGPGTGSTGTGTSTSSDTLHVLTLNCWGLKYLSKHRSQRLAQIGAQLAAHRDPPLDIVCLQECWTYSDYATIKRHVHATLPHAKFYHSGIFGGGLALFARHPILESNMYRYPLNGRPTAFFRGDWFVGKGVAHAKLRWPGHGGQAQYVEVFNTHLHAPYEKEPNDSYICHRTAQAWEIAKLLRAASERGSLVLGMGDFNMVPLSFAHVLVESRGGVRDVWRVVHPASAVGASRDPPERARRQMLGEKAHTTVEESLRVHGHTCDSVLNTWRWNKAHRAALDRGRDRTVDMAEPDDRAKRLDYIFVNGLERGWHVQDVRVGMTDRHPTLKCSLSDHFAVEATLSRTPAVSPSQREETVEVAAPWHAPDTRKVSEDIVEFDEKSDFQAAAGSGQLRTRFHLEPTFYEQILAMVVSYTRRERRQRRYRTLHFAGAVTVSIGCCVGVWWSPPGNYVAFVLLLVSTLGLMAGTVDGLIGGLFVGSELRALAEFEWEVRNAWRLAGGPQLEEAALRDWYD